jgi:hypothetical protein
MAAAPPGPQKTTAILGDNSGICVTFDVEGKRCVKLDKAEEKHVAVMTLKMQV